MKTPKRHVHLVKSARTVATYDLSATLRMLKGEREAAKESKDKEAMKILDGLIKKLRDAR